MGDRLTVGQLRKAIESLPDDAPVCPDWGAGIPDDGEPQVRLAGFSATANNNRNDGKSYLS